MVIKVNEAGKMPRAIPAARGFIAFAAAFLLLGAAAGSVRAAEYFVSRRGSDAAAGTSEASAFGTIARGISALGAGDTLTILPGEYFESVMGIRLEGTPEAPVTIRARRPGTVLIQGDVPVTGPWEPVDAGAGIWATAFSPRVEGVADRRAMRLFRPALEVGGLENHLGAFYQDEENGRLYVRTPDAGDPNGLPLSASVVNGYGLGFTGSRHVVVDGLSFTGFQNREFGNLDGSRIRGGLYFQQPENVVVRRCTAFLNSSGIKLSGSKDSVVEDCYSFGNHSYIEDIGNNIMGWGPLRMTMRRNRVEGFFSDPASTSSSDLAFYSGPPEGESVLEENLAINAGIMNKGGLFDTVHRGNITFGEFAYYYRPVSDDNLILKSRTLTPAMLENFADPVNRDFRLQSDAPIRGRAGEDSYYNEDSLERFARKAAGGEPPSGRDPGPFPWREEVFFVSPRGDDRAPGTSLQKAWRTLGHAAAAARPGQTVYILGGEYAESLAPAQSGSAQAPIVFRRHGRDRVVLDGRGEGAPLIDLRGRSHVAVEGLVLRNFTGPGVAAGPGQGLKIERLAIFGGGIEAEAAPGIELRHNLIAGSTRAGIELRASPGALLAGNLFAPGAGAALVFDEASLEGLWSDYNGFVPGLGVTTARTGNPVAASLDDWRAASGQDASSLEGPLGFPAAAAAEAGFELPERSPWIGAGPHASVIGPFLRVWLREWYPRARGLEVRSRTDTTANLEWEFPGTRVSAVVEWGETPELGREARVPVWMGHHVAGLRGLVPGREYHARVRAALPGEKVIFAVSWPEDTAAEPEAPPSEVLFFRTEARRPEPRSFHVSVEGSDENDGLRSWRALRTISQALSRVVAGDTVIVHKGVYAEQARVMGTGDEGAPVTLMAAPGADVWWSGENFTRLRLLMVYAMHHVVIDGFRFREVRKEPFTGFAVDVRHGSAVTVRRCLYDGRRAGGGYPGIFLNAADTPGLLVENCVVIGGFSDGLRIDHCPGLVVRHSVFYNNYHRSMTVMQRYLPFPDLSPCIHLPQDDTPVPYTLSHNLFVDGPPHLMHRVLRLQNVIDQRSDHNGFFSRLPAEERHVVDTNFIGARDVREGVGLRPLTMTLAEIRELGLDRNSIFGNPGIRAVGELEPLVYRREPERNKPNFRAEWEKNEMRWNRDERRFERLDFDDFFADPAGPMGRSAAGRPIGLDPAAFGRETPHQHDREPGFAWREIDRESAPERFKPREYLAHRAEGPVTIDGRLDEPSWQAARWTEDNVHILGGPYRRPTYSSRNKILWDDEHLYIGGRLEEPNLLGRETENDAILCRENNYEIFIDAGGRGRNYIELEFNVLGTVWDILYGKELDRGARPAGWKNIPEGGRFNIEGLRLAVRPHGTINFPFDEDEGWTFECAIPWATLEKTVPEGDRPLARDGNSIRLNFSRVQAMIRHHWPITDWTSYRIVDWTWSPMLVYRTHATEMFGRVILSQRGVSGEPDLALRDRFPFLAPPAPPGDEVEPGSMTLIPGGIYPIGSDDEDPSGASPAGEARLEAFYIDRYQVTVGEYASFLNSGGQDDYYHRDMADPDLCGIVRDADGSYRALPGRERYPVTLFPHHGPAAYARWAGKRLPTEFEWEAAARGREGRLYPWGDEPPDPSRANYGFHYGHTLPVGSFPAGATPEGVHDLAGNLNDFIGVAWNEYPWGEKLPPRQTPSRRLVCRGGAWSGHPEMLKSTFRNVDKYRKVRGLRPPDIIISPLTGFRCAR